MFWSLAAVTRGLVQTSPRSFREGRVWESLVTVTGFMCGMLDRQKKASAARYGEVMVCLAVEQE